MTETVFVDTGYILALVNENDQHHAQALALSEQFDGQPIIVTDAVLLEIGNASNSRASSIAHRERAGESVFCFSISSSGVSTRVVRPSRRGLDRW